MVDTVSVSRINVRDLLSVDIEVWMKHPDDMDFKPRLKIVENTLIHIQWRISRYVGSIWFRRRTHARRSARPKNRTKGEISSSWYAWKIEYNQSDYR